VLKKSLIDKTIWGAKLAVWVSPSLLS